VLLVVNGDGRLNYKSYTDVQIFVTAICYVGSFDIYNEQEGNLQERAADILNVSLAPLCFA